MRYILVFLLSVFSLNTYPHSDTILQLEGGKLVGLPDEYLPAEFDFADLRLSISGRVVIFPECIKTEFNFDIGELLIASSWYHEARTGSLPPYITFGHEDSYPENLLISLDTLLPVPIEWGYGADEKQRKCIDEFKLGST